MPTTTTQVNFRRGTAAQISTFTPSTGEIVIDLTNRRPIIGDGFTVGGFSGALLTDLNTSITNLSGYTNNVTNLNSAGLSILSGNLGATGSNLFNSMAGFNSLLTLVSNNLTQSGITLITRDNNISGAINTTIQNSGQINYLYNSGISGNLTSTGIFLINRDNTISGILNLSIQNTGSILYNDILNLSGIVNNINLSGISISNVIYTTGNQNIGGNKYFTGILSANSLSGNLNVYDSLGEQTASLSSRTLLDQFQNLSLDWQNRIFVYDVGGTSIDYQNGIAYDINNHQSLNWHSRSLLSSFGVSTLNWGALLNLDQFSNASIDWGNRHLLDSSAHLVLDWSNYLIYDGSNSLSIDWNNRILSGNWNIQSGNFTSGLTINGLGVITTAQTGGFGGGGIANTGQLTGLFYPLTSNPSGYISSYNQSGSYIFSKIPISGVTSEFIKFPSSLGNNPYVICSLSNLSGNENIVVQSSGITSSGYYTQYSNIIDGSGYLLTTLASTSSQTGLATTIIIQNNLTTTGIVTGFFYPLNSNPSGYISGFNSGIYITSGQTGQFYPSSNTSFYATSGNLASTGSILYNDIVSVSTSLNSDITNLTITGQTLYNNITGLSGSLYPASLNYNISINWAASNTFYTILTGNSNFSFINQRDGQMITVSVSNTGNAGYVSTWPANLKWSLQTPPTQTSGNFTDIYTFLNITGATYGSAIQGF